jgi:hypothetical protein
MLNGIIKVTSKQSEREVRRENKNVLDVTRVHLHEWSMFHEDVAYSFGHIHRQLTISVNLLELFWRLHHRGSCPLQGRQEALIVEREQCLDTAEHDLGFTRGYNGLLAGTDATEDINWHSPWLDIDVNGFLEAVSVCALGPER